MKIYTSVSNNPPCWHGRPSGCRSESSQSSTDLHFSFASVQLLCSEFVSVPAGEVASHRCLNLPQPSQVLPSNNQLRSKYLTCDDVQLLMIR